MDTSETILFQKMKNYNKIMYVFIFSMSLYIIAAIFNGIFVDIMPIDSFLTWHTLLEFGSIFASLSIFMVTYIIYEESGDLQMIIFGSTFLLMAWLDMFHTLSYKGMPVFFIANTTANRATVLWILSRFIGSLGILTSISIPINTTSNLKKEAFSLGTTLLTFVLFLIVTYYPNFFPPMYIEVVGMTGIKIFLEYMVILIFGISFFIIASQYRKSNSNILYKFMIALVLLIFTEFSFTSYGSVYDAYNYLGHVYKIIAYGILYKAIYIENINAPYRELKKTKNELKNYSDNLNIIVSQRTEKLEEINGELLNDLEYAKEMQRCLLPEQMPEDMSVVFDAEYLAADNLSGDFYNVVKLDENNIAIYIGDVSGHGVSAAMLTVFAYQNVIHLKRLKEDGNPESEFIKPSVVLGTIYNSFNRTNINDEKYIVMLYGIYNIKNKSFQYASAGINVSPYIIRKSGELLELNAKGFPICKFGDYFTPTYENRTIQLETGDKLFFYSDGIVEAKDKSGEEYGNHKLKSFLKNKHSFNSSELNKAIKDDFFKHIGHGSPLMDDVTFLTMLIVD